MDQNHLAEIDTSPVALMDTGITQEIPGTLSLNHHSIPPLFHSSFPPFPEVPILDIRDLIVEKRSFLTGRKFKLINIALSVHRGEFVVICGEEGCGKSLLTKMILRIPQPKTRIALGQISLNNVDIHRMKPSEIREVRQKKIFLISREIRSQFDPDVTVRQYLAELVKLTGRQTDLGEEYTWTPLFLEVGIVEPEKILGALCSEIKLITMQRLMLMSALISGAELLLCDEATAQLDAVSAQAFTENLALVNENRKLAILFTSGHLKNLEGIAHRIYIMFEGGILESGTPRELLNQPKFTYTNTLINSTPLLGSRVDSFLTPDRESIADAEKVIQDLRIN